MKNKPGVKYIDSILKEVAEEQGRELKEVKEAWRLHKDYIKSLIDSGEVDIIELPRLGNLYFNAFTYRAFSSRPTSKINPTQQKQDTRIRQMIVKDREVDRKTSYIYPQVKRGAIYNLFKSINKVIDKRKKAYSTLTKIIKRVEEYSTKIFRDEQ